MSVGRSWAVVTRSGIVDYRSGWLLVGCLCCLVCDLAVAPQPNIIGISWSVVRLSLPLMAVALGSAIVIAVGDIDLSPAGLISLLGVVLLVCASSGIPAWAAMVIVILIAVTVGLAHGLAVSKLGVPPLVLTLGSSFCLLGVATIVMVALQRSASRGASSTVTLVLPGSYVHSWFSMGWVWVLAPLTFISVWRHASHDGLRHLAVGSDRQAASLAAIPVPAIRMRAFIYSSALVSLGTLLLLHYQGGGWTARAGLGYELKGIAAAVIGGARISGGSLKPINVAFASLLLVAIESTTITASWITAEMQGAIIGALVVIAAVIDRTRTTHE